MMNQEYIDEIRRAEEKVLKYAASPENIRRNAFYKDDGPSSGYWYGIPVNDEVKPIVVELEREMYAKVLNFSMVEYYNNPFCHYLNTLRIMIYKFENFHDCTPISTEFSYFPGAGFEKSIYGFNPIHSEHDSWISRELMFKENERPPLKDLKLTDFYTSGCMPEYHEFYEQICEIAGNGFLVAFPQWIRSPWAVAWELRGIENLLIDVIEDPEWVAELVNYITDCRISWCRQWEKFSNKAMHTCMLGNDEVTSPMVSPGMYKNIIKPSEIRLSEAFGGINYWHSCGNTTPFMSEINTIPNLDMVHVSPWSDLALADSIYDKDKRLEIALFAYEDVLYPKDESHIERKLTAIKHQSANHRCIITANGIQIINDLNEGLERVKKWIELATKILLEEEE